MTDTLRLLAFVRANLAEVHAELAATPEDVPLSGAVANLAEALEMLMDATLPRPPDAQPDPTHWRSP